LQHYAPQIYPARISIQKTALAKGTKSPVRLQRMLPG